MSALRIAVLQSSGRPGSVAGNLVALDEAAGRAAEAGARLLLAPELFLTGYAVGDLLPRLAEPADGPGAREVAAIAARHGLAVAYGWPERDGERLHNAAQVITPDGDRLAHYRKTHLYGDFEARWFTPGDTLVVQAEFGGLRLGVLVCFDVEFPEAVRTHALAGTELLLVPTGLMRPYEQVATGVVPVRALENQLWIAYANRTGPEGEFDFAGHSLMAGPRGVAAAAGPGPAQELLIVDVDPASTASSRAEWPYLQGRRPELYGSLARP